MPISTHRARREFLRLGAFTAYLGYALAGCAATSDPVVARAITELAGPTSTVNVGQGFSTKSVIAIKRSSNFDGMVLLTAEALPQGLLVSFAPASLSSTATLSEMTISALSTVSPGAQSFTVRASGEGVQSKTLSVLVMVSVPSIHVAPAATTTTVPQGGTQVVPITIVREGGFEGLVGFSVLGLPSGVTASFSPPSVESGATATALTLTALLSAQLGVKTVTLRAAAQGLADRTVPIDLTVGPATSPAVLLTASPLVLTVTGGQTVETTLTIQRFAGFNGVVAVTVDGLPPLLEASAEPFAPGSNTTTLRISGKPEFFSYGSQPIGTFTLAVRANGQSIPQASTSIAVTTTFMPQFNLFFDTVVQGEFPPTSQTLTINRGANASTRLQVLRFQYAHPIAMSVTGAPSNVTTNLPATIPTSAASQEFFVMVAVGADAVPGVYNLVIRGEGSTSPLVRQATIVLTVQ